MGAQPSLRQIGKYVVIDVIGTGGMGIVFSAQDPALGRKVAIKMLKHSEGETSAGLFGRFFSREMKSTGNLHHKNIVTVYDSGEQDGNPYLVMEYLEGEPVSRLIAERRSIPMEEKLSLMIQVCDGLQYAHDRSVIHRDVKPANVILLPDGTAKIVDFGVSRIAGSETSLVQTGQLVGSLSYMSPEQINSIPIDARSDIFSTGVMLYELLTFELPFKGTDPASTFVKILREEPFPLSRFLRDIPDGMQTVVSRALAKNVNDRYQSAEEFGFDLMAVQKEIKSTIISDCMKRAEAAMHRGDLDRVRDSLLEVIRLDRQNERANRLLREVRKAIQQQQRSAQVIQMRSQAQVALAGAQYEEALACADQALRLDPSDQESVMLCQEISNAISRAKSVRDALARAESALFAGDFDEAKEAIEESLRLDPADSEARALASVVNKELEERSRRQQVQQFVTLARRGIAERKFTDALDALRRAEELDPSDSNVRELLQWANRGQEQERRRRFLVEITDEIEKALHAGDFNSACTISEMGLLRFPDESTLVRLRAISEKQRDIADRRKFVQDQSLAFKTLHDQGKVTEAMQTLTDGLRKYPGEPNLESLLAATKAEIEEQKIERERSERLKEIQRAEAEARAQLTKQVLNWSIEIRRLLDVRSDLGDILKSSAKLRAAIDGKQIDEHASEVADLVLTEVDARLRARDQAVVELEQLRVASEQAQDADSLSEAENRLLSIKAAFPNESTVQQACSNVASAVAVVRERRDQVLASLTRLAHAIESTPTGELGALLNRARETASAFAGDARVGALMQQIESSASRRLARHEELLRDMDSLRADLARAHSIAENNRIAERAKSIVASDALDDELADRGRLVQVEAARLRSTLQDQLDEMATLAEAIETAETVHQAEALIPAVKLLAERQLDFQDLQEAATRALAQVQGRRMEHDLIVQELESARSAVYLLDSPEELASAAARAIQCRDQHSHDATILSICQEIEAEVEKILVEKTELRERMLECDRALQTAEEQVRSHRLVEALSILQSVEFKNPDRTDLAQQLAAVRRALELEEAERRRVAIDEAIETAGRLLAQGFGAEALGRLSAATSEYPDSEELRNATKAADTEVKQQRVKQERVEVERRERERLEQERIAREVAEARRVAIHDTIEAAREMLEQGQGQQALEGLRAGLERYADSVELSAAIERTTAEVARQQAETQRLEEEQRALERAEQDRLEAERRERERLEQERIAREAAEARRVAIQTTIETTREMLERGRGQQALEGLQAGLELYADSVELSAAMELTKAEVAREQAETQRLEEERREQKRVEQERLDAEQREQERVEREAREQERIAREADEARRAAIQNIIHASQAMLEHGQARQGLEHIEAGLMEFAESEELKAALEAAKAELAHLLAEQERREAERLEVERLEKERLEAERRERERLERARLEQERIAIEEAGVRRAAIQATIRSAQEMLDQGRGQQALHSLGTGLEQFRDSEELRSALESTTAEVMRRRAAEEKLEAERVQKERLEQERLEAERRESARLEQERIIAKEAEDRRTAIEEAVQTARTLLARGRSEESLQLLRGGMEQYAGNEDLRIALEITEEEVRRQRAQQEMREAERQQRERLEQERLEQERIAREVEGVRRIAVQTVISAAGELLARGRGDEGLQSLQRARKQYPESHELQLALESMQAEVSRLRGEQQRLTEQRIEKERSDQLERKRLEQKRLEEERLQKEARERERREEIRRGQERAAKEQAEARRVSIESSIRLARELLAQGRGEQSLQHLNAAVTQFPDSPELRSVRESTQAEVTKNQAKQKQLGQQRLKHEQQTREQERIAVGKTAIKAPDTGLSQPKEEQENTSSVSTARSFVGSTEDKGGSQAGLSEPADGSLSSQHRNSHRGRYLAISAAALLVLSVTGYFLTKRVPKSTTTSSVVFRTDPAGSSLTIDGKSVDCPGSCNVPLSFGSHHVTLTKEGYSSAELPIAVDDSTDRIRPVALKIEPIQTKPLAISTLALVSNMGPSIVSLDGRQFGELASHQVESEQLRTGQHQVRVVKDGKALTLSVQVSQQGEVLVDDAEGLEPSAVLALTQDGTFGAIFCRCGGGKIQIDGKPVNPIRRNIYRLPTQNLSEHNVRLFRTDLNQPITLAGFVAQHAVIRIQTPGPVQPVALPNVAVQKQASSYSAVTAPQVAIPEQRSAATGTSQKSATTAPIPAQAPTVVNLPADVGAWNGIKESNEIDVLNRFRTQFPGSPYAKIASQRMELLAWDKIHNSEQQSDFQNFLREYPEGTHASEARNRLVSLAVKAQQQDRTLIEDALEAYRSAYQRKDLNGLAAVWKTVPRSQFQLVFDHADRIVVTLSPSGITITGDQANVIARQHVEIMLNGKTVSKNDTSIQFTLKKTQGRWLIESTK